MSKYFLFVAVLLLASCAPAKASAPSQPTSVIPVSGQISTPAPSHEITAGVVVVNILNVREGPGTSYPTVGSFNKGEKFYILGEVINSTNNKWLLISLSDNSFGWVTGDQSYVAIQRETVDDNVYSTWQKNVEAAQSLLVTPTASP